MKLKKKKRLRYFTINKRMSYVSNENEYYSIIKHRSKHSFLISTFNLDFQNDKVYIKL